MKGYIMPRPVNEDGITSFKLSPEECEVIKLRKRIEELERQQDNIRHRLDSIK